MRPFTKVTPGMWTSAPFRLLPDDARLLWLYYLSGPHQMMTGVARIPDAYAADDLRWPVEKVRAARERLCKEVMIQCDEQTDEVLMENWWRENRPDNEAHRKGIEKTLPLIKSSVLRKAAETGLESDWQRRQEAKRAKTDGVGKSPDHPLARNLDGLSGRMG